MKFQTHNDDPSLDIYDTSWTYSTIQATQRQLIVVFGEPLYSGGKVQREWVIKFEDGTVATIYDWKEHEYEADELINWHIGASQKSASIAVTSVHNAFREALGLSARSA